MNKFPNRAIMAKEQKDLESQVKDLEKENKKLAGVADTVPKLEEKIKEQASMLKEQAAQVEKLADEKRQLEKIAGKISSTFPVLPEPGPDTVKEVRLICEVQLSEHEKQQVFRIQTKDSGILMLEIRTKDGKCIDSRFEVLKSI